VTAAQLNRHLRAQPFVPFILHLADQRRFAVQHPELLLLSGGGRLATFHSPREFQEVIDVLMIVSVRLNAPEGELD
jgi:hypothetical protein